MELIVHYIYLKSMKVILKILTGLLHNIPNKEIKARIISMVLTTNEDYLILGLDNGTIY